jgi:hypothetical protein
MVPHDWLKASLLGTHSFTFAAIIWWAWRHHNMMCLSQYSWSLHGLVFYIQSIYGSNHQQLLHHQPSSAEEDKFIKWNHNNHSNVILNVDGICLGLLTRADFGCLLRNYVGFYFSGFSGFVQNSTNILQAELLTIYHGLSQAKEMAIADLVCYSDFLHCINIIKGSQIEFHTYAVLIQDIKEFIDTICHTLRDREPMCGLFDQAWSFHRQGRSYICPCVGMCLHKYSNSNTSNGVKPTSCPH